MEHVSPDMCDKFYCIFESQENCHYIVGWSRTGQLIRISIADHSAVIHHQQSRELLKVTKLTEFSSLDI